MAQKPDSPHFDYIVVGAGSAGCVLANQLTASGKYRVLLLEAGGRDSNIWIHIPLGYGKLFSNPKVNWLYKTEPEPELNNRQVIQPRGKVLGGSSSINGLLYIRGQREDYDHWRQLGNPGWSFTDVLPYFRRAEDQERGADELHGVGGHLKVSNVCEPHVLCEAFMDAAEQSGFPRTDDFNGLTQEGAGYFQLTTRNGRRWSTAVGYLKEARRRPNLRVEVNALATRVLFSGRRHRISPGRDLAHRLRRRRDDPVRRRVQLAAAVAALRRRPGGFAARPRHRRDRRYSGRRRRPAGSFANPLSVPLHRTDHHERRDQ
jgi:choline dehydrogenase